MKRSTLSLALFSLLALTPSFARAGAAAEAFKAKHEQIVELVANDASDAKLGSVLDQLIDYRHLAESSLGGPENYAKVCADRCAEFEALLTKLIRANYLRMARQAHEHPLELIGDEQGRGGVHKVTTKFKAEKNGRERTVTVEYVMHRVGDRWQIRDIITDEVSLARTYRHEFAKIAKAEGIDGIIQRLEDKLADS